MKTPTPNQIKKARKKAGLSKTKAAKIIYQSFKTWQEWEAGEQAMDPAFLELFNLKASSLDHQ